MGENLFRDVSILAGAIGRVIDLNSNDRSYHNNWHDTVYRPVYTPPVINVPVYSPPVIQTSVPEGCFGNQSWNNSRQWHRHSERRNYGNCPRYIPNYGGTGSYQTFPNTQVGTYSTNTNSAYPNIIYGGDGQQTAKIQIAGRELEFNQATGSMTSRNPLTGATKTFSGINSSYNNSFSSAEKQQLSNGMTVERNLGDENRAKIYFVPSPDRSRIESIVVKYDNQVALTVGNLSSSSYGRGLYIPNLNNTYGDPNSQNQPV